MKKLGASLVTYSSDEKIKAKYSNALELCEFIKNNQQPQRFDFLNINNV